MEITNTNVFQADADIVNSFYAKASNYLIELNESASREYCVLYFSSNDLYYPNHEIAFTEQLIKKNRFEWYGNRVNYAYKHIFIRDIKKQWYLTGINAEINTPQKLGAFLKKETEGFKVIAIGSSAGGFASVIFGQLLKAERIYTFNGQFEILSLLKKSKPEIDPILFRNCENSDLLPFYDATRFIDNPSSIYYFQSSKSAWDIEQYDYVKKYPINLISFTTSNHGIPFLKSNLPVVLNMSANDLNKFTGKTIHPLTFSLKIVGLIQTLKGLRPIISFAMNKIYINTFMKWKVKKK